MKITEWTLILFTVLGQASIGGFLLLTVLRQRYSDPERDGIYRKSAAVLLGLSTVALVASLFHLGQPAKALNALANLGSSWLSREIFFTGGFFVLLAAGRVLEKNPSVRRIVDWLAVLAGILSVISMASVYAMTMRPAWQGFNPYVAFGCTALFLGAALPGGLLVFFAPKGVPAGELQTLVWVGVAALTVQLIVLPLYLTNLAAGVPAAQQSAALLAGPYWIAWVVRWALALAGGLVPLLLVGRQLSQGKSANGLVYTALLFILCGELMGRFLFYATGISIGIG